MDQLFQQIELDILKCDRCPRLKQVTIHPHPHINYTELNNIKIFGIGRNPGLECDYTHILYDQMMRQYREDWWSCKFGKYIRTNLGDDLVQNHMFFTNVCKCSSPKNSKLTSLEKSNCNSFLEHQIDVVKPKLIITFGTDARESLYPFIINNKYKNNIKTLNLYHPSYFIYVKDKTKITKQTKYLSRVKEHFENE